MGMRHNIGALWYYCCAFPMADATPPHNVDDFIYSTTPLDINILASGLGLFGSLRTHYPLHALLFMRYIIFIWLCSAYRMPLDRAGAFRMVWSSQSASQVGIDWHEIWWPLRSSDGRDTSSSSSSSAELIIKLYRKPVEWTGISPFLRWWQQWRRLIMTKCTCACVWRGFHALSGCH